jgi:hypothetical protein
VDYQVQEITNCLSTSGWSSALHVDEPFRPEIVPPVGVSFAILESHRIQPAAISHVRIQIEIA